MKIYTLWKMWDDEGVELLFATDEYTYESNWDYWLDGCNAAMAKYGIQSEDTRTIAIEIPDEKVVGAFLLTEVEGEVVQ